ncbi:hypothetical protein Hanom_Chr15g01369731 [Helianthus anomalus]
MIFISPLVRFRCKISVRIAVPILSALLTDISPIFQILVHFFLVLPFVFLLRVNYFLSPCVLVVLTT